MKNKRKHLKQKSRQVSRGSAGDYQADEQAGVGKDPDAEKD